MIYIFDLDGTLADCRHRLKYLQQEPKDWDAFFDACDQDAPITDVIDLFQEIIASERSNDPVLFITGRPERIREKTKLWLRKHTTIWDANLYMRKDGDHRPDDIVKKEIFQKEVLSRYDFSHIAGVFEDRDRVVAMYRSLGLRCYQVAPGAY